MHVLSKIIGAYFMWTRWFFIETSALFFLFLLRRVSLVFLVYSCLKVLLWIGASLLGVRVKVRKTSKRIICLFTLWFGTQNGTFVDGSNKEW